MANATTPQVGRSDGHERAVFMATSGHFYWPPVGSSEWPLTPTLRNNTVTVRGRDAAVRSALRNDVFDDPSTR